MNKIIKYINRIIHRNNMNMDDERICKHCKEKITIPGRHYVCVKCKAIMKRESNKKYQQKNKDKINLRQRELYNQNKDRYKTYIKKWVIKNPDKVRENRRKYAQKNTEKRKAYYKKYFAAIRADPVKSVQLKEYYKKRREMMKMKKMENGNGKI